MRRSLVVSLAIVLVLGGSFFTVMGMAIAESIPKPAPARYVPTDEEVSMDGTNIVVVKYYGDFDGTSWLDGKPISTPNEVTNNEVDKMISAGYKVCTTIAGRTHSTNMMILAKPGHADAC